VTTGIVQGGWKHRLLVWGLIGVGGLLIAAALLWPWIPTWAPRLAVVIADIATHPATWASTAILLLSGHLLMRWRTMPLPAQQETVATPSNEQSNRDLLLLLDFAVDQTTIEFLDDLMTGVPRQVLQDPSKGNAETYAASADFVKRASNRISHTHRSAELQSILNSAEFEAEQAVESTPVENRPKDVDVLMLRRWAIASLQCARAYEYLASQRKQVKDRLRNKRDGLIEQLGKRNPR
jgi:hypothetical protein